MAITRRKFMRGAAATGLAAFLGGAGIFLSGSSGDCDGKVGAGKNLERMVASETIELSKGRLVRRVSDAAGENAWCKSGDGIVSVNNSGKGSVLSYTAGGRTYNLGRQDWNVTSVAAYGNKIVLCGKSYGSGRDRTSYEARVLERDTIENAPRVTETGRYTIYSGEKESDNLPSVMKADGIVLKRVYEGKAYFVRTGKSNIELDLESGKSREVKDMPKGWHSQNFESWKLAKQIDGELEIKFGKGKRVEVEYGQGDIYKFQRGLWEYVPYEKK